MKRHGKRVKVGPRSYMNINGKGQISSFSSGTKGYRVTNYMSGAKRTTINHGDGYYDSFYQGVHKNRKFKAYSGVSEGSGALSFIALIAYGAYKFSFFLVQIAFGIFILSFPLTLLYAVYQSRYVNHHAPQLSDAFDDSEMHNHVENLVRALEENESLIAAAYAEGIKNGVRLTKSSGEKYFDVRSPLGSTLNAEIDYLHETIRLFKENIEENRKNIIRSIPPFREDCENWISGRARILAFRNSLYALPLITGISFFIIKYYHDVSLSFARIVIWEPVSFFDPTPAFLGVIFSYIVLFLSRIYYNRALWQMIDHCQIKRWEDLEGKWKSFSSIDKIKSSFRPEMIQITPKRNF